MLCFICREAELADGTVSVTLEHGETKIIVNNVPAQVCPKCRDAVVAEEVAIRLLDTANEMFSAGSIESTQDFQGL